MKVVVSGMAAGVPGQGGATWAVLQFVLGLRRLGHEVVLVEEVDDLDRCAEYFMTLVHRFGLDGALLERSSGRSLGISRNRLQERADLLLNISGVLRDEELLDRTDLRVFVDVDPAFTQLWQGVEGIDLGFDRHHRFVTVGPAIGTDGCNVPTCGRSWIATRQPIVLDHWPVATRLVHHAATTVGHWRGYGSIVHDGVHYGQRAHSMRALLDLTDMTSVRLMLALAIDPGEQADIEALQRHRWSLIDPGRVAGTPDDYRAFVQGSWAELGIAKRGYVASGCGWFSDRSACYLASGRPVVAQETGWSRWLPTGDGLLSFTTPEQAAAALEEVRRDYPRHRRAARELAEELFDSDRVLSQLLEAV